MNVQVTISVGANDTGGLSGTATEIAQKILVAVGGDETKDTVNVVINDSGSAGSYPTMASPPES